MISLFISPNDHQLKKLWAYGRSKVSVHLNSSLFIEAGVFYFFYRDGLLQTFPVIPYK